MQIKLSVVIITYNEEKNIARCIDSVIDIADDIVVIDSYSTDNTEAICKQKQVRFVKHAFQGHIQQKNWAITQAKYPYVLSLDADEAVDETLKKSIQNIKNNWKHDGYSINRLTNYCGKWIKHGGWYPDIKLRLWNAKKGKWTGINPHDEFVMEKTAKIKHIKGNILHYSYNSLSEHIQQIDKFTQITAQAYFDNKKTCTWDKLYINPLIRFIKGYFFQAGFLDGHYGYLIAKYSAFATYVKYSKLKQMYIEKQ